MPDLRKTSLGLGTGQQQAPRAADHTRPNMPVIGSPRDGGSMADGETGGNFDLSSMTKLPNNAGPKGTESGIDAANAAQESYSND